MNLRPARRSLFVLALAGCALAAGFAAAPSAEPQQKAAATPKFIGAAKCKMCHASVTTGDQHGKWKQEKHAKAFATLATAESKALAKAKGIDDPQKSEQCVKCHVTAATEPAERLAKGFDRADGVQCETCHGPGEKHMKARMAAAAEQTGNEPPARVELPKDELPVRPDEKLCRTCHNEESPSFKPFCFKHRIAEIDHFDPRNAKRKEQRDAELAKLPCTCPEGARN